jgi:hypothetical protein
MKRFGPPSDPATIAVPLLPGAVPPSWAPCRLPTNLRGGGGASPLPLVPGGPLGVLLFSAVLSIAPLVPANTVRSQLCEKNISKKLGMGGMKRSYLELVVNEDDGTRVEKCECKPYMRPLCMGETGCATPIPNSDVYGYSINSLHFA